MTSRRRANAEAWALAAPAAALYAAFVLVPLGYALAMSFAGLRSGGGDWTPQLANYSRALSDPVFWRALLHNAILLVASVAIQVPAALALALLVAGAARAAGALRAAYFLPMMLPTAAIGWIWMLLLDPTAAGPVNAALAALGVPRESLPMWLGSTRAALPSIIFVVSWRHVGFHMVILLAGLVSIPEELYEAARVDGAGVWECFRHVTLPMMSRPLSISAMLAVVGSVRYFDLVYIMTGGGPAGSTELVATYMFKSGLGEAGEYSYGAALAVLLVAASMIVLGAARLCLRSRESAVEVVR